MIHRTFLVTGATKGIGLAISGRLAHAGHQIIGIAQEPLSTFPGTVCKFDLGDDQASAGVLSDLAERFSCHGVVNKAGVGRRQRLDDVAPDVVDELTRLNLHAPIIAVQAILPTLHPKGWGRIVNITSLATLRMVNCTAYAASKAAPESFYTYLGARIGRNRNHGQLSLTGSCRD